MYSNSVSSLIHIIKALDTKQTHTTRRRDAQGTALAPASAIHLFL